MYDFLKNVDLFTELPEADLRRLCEVVEKVELLAGQELFAEGSVGDRAYIIQQGELEIIKSSDGREVQLEVRQNKPGLVIGEMALVEEAPRMATVRASRDSVLLAIQKEQFDHILNTSPAAAQAMLRMVLRRWRSNEARLRQSEKMAQLGTFTAGIAHELNNPAAAVRRSTGQLEMALNQFGQIHARLARIELAEAQQNRLIELDQQIRERAAHPPVLDVLVRSDRESAVEAWLEEQDMADAWDIAPTLVDMGYDVVDLETLVDDFASEQLPAIIGWLTSTYTAYNLLTEIGQGAARVSEIVKALKSYAYLDQAPVQMVDVQEGLEETLLILRHKLKTGIIVRRDYAPDMPQFAAYGNELNQVWTNLIDNAIDAVGEQGEIIIRTYQDGDKAMVEIEDNGPGIPPEVQSKIFDPFFTTKPPGQGTGLGLDISYNIVARRHQGDLTVFSKPGQTCFKVCLPLNLEVK